MPVTVKEIYDHLDRIAPFAAQAEWDNSGLLLGSPDACVERAVICLDLTARAVAFAAAQGAQLVISHHPVIFRAVRAIPEKSVLWALIRQNIAVISAHTNLDKAAGGVNDTLCETLGMRYEKPAEPFGEGFLNVGEINGIPDAAALAEYLRARLGGPVRYIDSGAPIGRIAVCCGAGGELYAEAARAGCTALITGDADHHDFLDAAACGVSLFAAGHYETEIPVVEKLRAVLTSAFPAVAFDTYRNMNPIRFIG